MTQRSVWMKDEAKNRFYVLLTDERFENALMYPLDGVQEFCCQSDCTLQEAADMLLKTYYEDMNDEMENV